jgi:glutaredoxin
MYHPLLSGRGIKSCPFGRAASEGLRHETVEPVCMSSAGTESAITLYRLQACPFCERVVRVLDDLDLDYESRFVEPLHSERNVVARLTNKRTVPAIVDEKTGVTMSESANIVEYLEKTYGAGSATADDDGVPAAEGGDD